MKFCFLSVRILLFCAVLFLCNPVSVFCQQSVRDSTVKMWMVDVAYGGYFSGGDFAKRFGYTSQIGVQFGYKFKTNIYFSAGANFVFGDDIRENNILKELGHTNSWVNRVGDVVFDQGWIDRNGTVIVPSLFQRGFTVPVRVGKIFNRFRFKGMNPNCGLFLEGGLQYMQHWIEITAPRETPYLIEDYAKGYDRMTQGLGMTGSIGYRFFGSSRFINFYVALDYQHHFTRNIRFNFDLGSENKDLRNDVLFGFRVGWCLPIYGAAPDQYYYY